MERRWLVEYGRVRPTVVLPEQRADRRRSDSGICVCGAARRKLIEQADQLLDRAGSPGHLPPPGTGKVQTGVLASSRNVRPPRCWKFCDHYLRTIWTIECSAAAELSPRIHENALRFIFAIDARLPRMLRVHGGQRGAVIRRRARVMARSSDFAYQVTEVAMASDPRPPRRGRPRTDYPINALMAGDVGHRGSGMPGLPDEPPQFLCLGFHYDRQRRHGQATSASIASTLAHVEISPGRSRPDALHRQLAAVQRGLWLWRSSRTALVTTSAVDGGRSSCRSSSSRRSS